MPRFHVSVLGSNLSGDEIFKRLFKSNKISTWIDRIVINLSFCAPNNTPNSFLYTVFISS